MKKLELQDLEKMPMTRKLLCNYITFMYQEDANTNDDYLLMEYNLLAREDRLDELFFQELLDNVAP